MSSLKLEDKEDLLGVCLDGLTIVVSGIFESISRDKLEEFINSHGGRNTGSVSGKTSYLVVGYKLEDNRDIN
jgi:BRCT domain type II-containing protein